MAFIRVDICVLIKSILPARSEGIEFLSKGCFSVANER